MNIHHEYAYKELREAMGLKPQEEKAEAKPVLELDEYSHPGVMSFRHKEIETCVGVPIEEHTEMHRRKNYGT